MTDTPRPALEALVEQHARIAVIPIQHQNDAYEPTPYEANALKNMRHILTQFAAAALASVTAEREAQNRRADQMEASLSGRNVALRAEVQRLTDDNELQKKFTTQAETLYLATKAELQRVTEGQQALEGRIRAYVGAGDEPIDNSIRKFADDLAALLVTRLTGSTASTD